MPMNGICVGNRDGTVLRGYRKSFFCCFFEAVLEYRVYMVYSNAAAASSCAILNCMCPMGCWFVEEKLRYSYSIRGISNQTPFQAPRKAMPVIHAALIRSVSHSVPLAWCRALLQLHQMLQASLDAHKLSQLGVVPTQDVNCHACRLSLQLDDSINSDASPIRGRLCGFPISGKGERCSLDGGLDARIKLCLAAKECTNDITVTGRERSVGRSFRLSNHSDCLIPRAGWESTLSLKSLEGPRMKCRFRRNGVTKAKSSCDVLKSLLCKKANKRPTCQCHSLGVENLGEVVCGG